LEEGPEVMGRVVSSLLQATERVEAAGKDHILLLRTELMVRRVSSHLQLMDRAEGEDRVRSFHLKTEVMGSQINSTLLPTQIMGGRAKA
jgi:hypothetical protein